MLITSPNSPWPHSPADAADDDRRGTALAALAAGFLIGTQLQSIIDASSRGPNRRQPLVEHFAARDC